MRVPSPAVVAPAVVALAVIAALAVSGMALVAIPGPPESPAVEVAPSPLPVGAEVIYEGALAASHGGFGYRLDPVGCGEGVCTAVVTATNEGAAPANVETAYFLHVAGQRVRPTGYSGEGFTRDVAPGEAVELRLRFPAAGRTGQVTRFEVADTVAASGILFDL